MRKRSRFLLLAAAVVLAAAGCPSKTTPKKRPAGGPWEGRLTVVTGDWTQLKALIDSHSSQVVVVDVWGTWNESGRREIPNLAKLQKKYGDKVACIVACCDFGFEEGESLEDVRAKAEKLLRKQFGKVLGKDEVLKPTVTLFIANQTTEDFYESAEIEAAPTVLIYGKTGKRIVIDDESVQPPPTKTAKTGTASTAPTRVTISYQKHVLPIVEKLIKE
ncbi:MAG: TlpA family protein disulfide reductase [Planctomycetaceae bacterium]